MQKEIIFLALSASLQPSMHHAGHGPCQPGIPAGQGVHTRECNDYLRPAGGARSVFCSVPILLHVICLLRSIPLCPDRSQTLEAIVIFACRSLCIYPVVVT